ncbi:MAG: VanZ family protein [Thermomicrobiales bacterium]
MIERALRCLPAVGWMALIFSLSSREQFPQPFGLSTLLLAIAAHLAMYGALALLILFAISREQRPTQATQLTAVVLACLYGLSDEFHQSFVPGRDASFFDVLVDTLGASIAVGLWSYRRFILSAVVFR